MRFRKDKATLIFALSVALSFYFSVPFLCSGMVMTVAS